MANVYARITKISNALGRSRYITDLERQEEIVLHKNNLQHNWSEHAAYEKAHQKTNVANNEALEVHFALPNKLYYDCEQLEAVCDELASRIVGTNKDYEYAVHWNHNRTNLHVHILFSERENQTELEPKIYKRNIYYNFEAKKLSNKSDLKAEIIHRKGEVQKDKDGNIKYQTEIFKAKDTKFISRGFVHEVRKTTQEVLKEFGYELDITTSDSPYLAQKKLYKGASKDYLEKAKAWNKAVKKYNEKVKEHISLNPEKYEIYTEIKHELTAQVRDANSQAKKITMKAVDLIKDMVDWVTEVVVQAKADLYTKAREWNLVDGWNTMKENYNDLFDENEKINHEIKSLEREERARNQMNSDISEVIECKNNTIREINRKERSKEDEFEI